RVFFPILYVLVVKFIFVVVQIPDWHWPPCQSGVWVGFESYPVGSPIPWPSATPPQGYLLMNGQSFSCSR
ncbi:phage tail protein, partial [Escherichia coli]